MNEFAVVFDLNGTIVDTELGYFLAYKEVLAEYDIEFQIEQFTENWSVKGKKLDDFLTTAGRSDLISKVPDMLLAKDQIFQNSIKERTAVIDGATQAVTSLSFSNIPLGLDSSTTLDNVRMLLSSVGLENIFKNIVAGDTKIDIKYGDVKRKSSRLKYLADLLGFSANQCIVIGDAEKDIEGAKQAGMVAIAVPNVYTRNNDFSLADAIFSSMSEVTVPRLAHCLNHV